MKQFVTGLVFVSLIGSAPSTFAGFFDFQLDGQIGYTNLGHIQHPDTGNEVTFDGASFGAHGMLKILFIALIVDYQHFFKEADLLHVGLGTKLGLPLSVVEPYVRGSVGLMMLDVAAAAFDPDANNMIDNELGLHVRAGGGLDVPLGEWFAVGVSADVGYHYITGEHGYDFSVMGYLGLRI